MSKHLARNIISEQATIVAEPIAARHTVDRSFELPKVLYGATVAFYLGFLGVMAAGFQAPDLAIPMAIFALFVFAGFGLPSLWVRMQPDNPARAMSWTRLRRDGVMTLTGRVAARDVAVQVLILPAIVFAWGLVTVTIAASVR